MDEERREIAINWSEGGCRKVAVFARQGSVVECGVSNGEVEELRPEHCVMAVVGAFVHRRIGIRPLGELKLFFDGVEDESDTR